MPKPTLPQRVSLQDAADSYGCHPRTIRRMISRGELTAYRLGKRLLRVDLNELDRAMRPIPTAGGDRVA